MSVNKIMLLVLILGGLALLSLITYLKLNSENVLSEYLSTNESMESTLDDNTSYRLFRVITDARTEIGAPSLQVSIIIKGRDKWTGSVGWADPKEKRAAVNNDLYHIGSISKMYTSAIIMMLVQEGKLSLQDPISKYIPNFPQGDKITIRNLMNHTSGISNYTEDLGFQMKTVLFRKKWTEEDIFALVNCQQPKFEPGKNHFYSNSNYVLLGEIAQKLSGKTFSTMLRENFLTPQGLNRTYFAPQECLPEHTVRGYDSDLFKSGILGIKLDMAGLRVPFELSAFTAGGIVGNASDVSEFTYNLYEGNTLKPETISMMSSFIEATDPDVIEQTGYGLGLRRLEIGGEELIGHTGVFPGFSNVSMYSPQKKYVITVLSNLSTAKVNYVIEQIQKELEI
jgi:D-alanyl-D-alanine carboxypeptidase